MKPIVIKLHRVKPLVIILKATPELWTKYILGRPEFLTNLPDTFFLILGVCMSCPEEDLDQGGRFLLQ